MPRLRIQHEWADRAAGCADAIDEPFIEWCDLTIRAFLKGRFGGVAVPQNALIVTRACSRPIHVPPFDMEPVEMRKAIVAGTIYAEGRRIAEPLPTVNGVRPIVKEWK